MTDSDDLIDFNIIETHKENIQSLPSGRSAKALARIFSPVATTGGLSTTQDINDAARADFEREIATIDESDDPLDVFDRYVKWTLEVYPSAQSTATSQLLPLLERATKAFVKDEQYKNDPRYLNLWLHYIRFFSDAPRETFAYLARHDIGEKLALYYEEFAQWLELNGRWAQAQEIYEMGAQKEARPAPRLRRKFGEFQQRATARSEHVNGPESPALPTVRAALAAKIDPFAAVISPADPQAASRNATTTTKSKKAKMQIFSDDGSTDTPAVSAGGSGWDDIGSMKERKKENTIAAQPMAGQTLNLGPKQNYGMPKMPIFKDQSESKRNTRPVGSSSSCLTSKTLNQRTGRFECVFVNLEAVYPRATDNNQGEDFSFEELRAASRGWLGRQWPVEGKALGRQTGVSEELRPPLSSIEAPQATVVPQRPAVDSIASELAVLIKDSLVDHNENTAPTRDENILLVNDENILLLNDENTLLANDENAPPPTTTKRQKMQIFSYEISPVSAKTPLQPKKMKIFSDEPPMVQSRPPPPPRVKTIRLNDENDENVGRGGIEREAEIAKKSRKEERANRTRKIKVREVRRDDQTIQTKLDSPQGSTRLRKKKIAEPTMTLHTKAATDDIYEIFNAPLASQQQPAEEVEEEEEDSETSEEEDDSDDDDYTSGGESTCTGRISGATSEYGEETQGDIEEAEAEEEQTQNTSENTGWSEFTISKPGGEPEEEVEASASDAEEDTDQQHENPVTSTRDSSEEADEDDLLTPHANAGPTAPHHMPMPLNDFRVPTRPFRDAQQAAYNRLPFMTPIVEKTESSIGTVNSRHEKDYFTAKTPCPKTSQKTPTIPEGDDEIWSSPFQDAIESKVVQQLPPPPMLTQTKSKPSASVTKTTPVEPPRKGPIIPDAQCNPMTEAIHATILAEVHPPIDTVEGYFDHGGLSFARKPEIRKWCKSTKSSRGNNDKTTTLAVPPLLRFEGETVYEVKRELGAGAYAPVYLIEQLDHESESGDENAVSKMGKGAFSLPRRSTLALKSEEPTSAWEFYILRTLHRRMGVSRASQSMIQAYEFHLFADEGYLIEEYLEQGTLLDLVNMTVAANAKVGSGASGGGALDEMLAMFFVVELLRTVEAMHAKGIIHGDLKADNVMLRLGSPSSTPSATSTSTSTMTETLGPYHPSGSSKWSNTGISLIDFGRGIDMRVFSPSVTFIADWQTGPTDCAEMRELRPWTYQADYHGIAAIAHTLLFGKYIETVVEKGTGNALGGGSGGKRYRLREGLKRWWQVELWTGFFELCLNSGACVEGEEGAKMPCLRALRRVREEMEEWLVVNCEKGVGLRGLLRKCEGLVAEKKRK